MKPPSRRRPPLSRLGTSCLADTKWFTHLVVVQAMIEALEGLDLQEPSPSPEECARLQAARASLEAEG